MHAIVAGGGAVGEAVAHTLTGDGHDVLVIEQSPARAEELRASGLLVEVGNATSPAVLEAAGALHAHVLIVCVTRDEDALVIAALCRRHFEVARIVGVVRDDEHRWLFDETWGVDVAISSTPVLTSLIETAAGEEAMVRVRHLLDDHLALVEVSIGADSPALGRSVAALALPARDLVATVVRAGVARPFTPDLTLAAGDLVLVVAALEDESLVRRAFEGSSKGE